MIRAMQSDADVLLRNVRAGRIIDVQVRAVRSTGTAASDIVGLA